MKPIQLREVGVGYAFKFIGGAHRHLVTGEKDGYITYDSFVHPRPDKAPGDRMVVRDLHDKVVHVKTLAQIGMPEGLTWEEGCKWVRDWCKENNAHYYAKTRELFDKREARIEAQALDKYTVVVEDLS
jgi:hypothetical protein